MKNGFRNLGLFAVVAALTIAAPFKPSVGAVTPLQACPPQQPNCTGPKPTPSPSPTPSPPPASASQLSALLAQYRSGPIEGYVLSGNWAVVAYGTVNNDQNAGGGLMLATHSSGSWAEVSYGAGGLSIGELTKLGVDQSDAQNLYNGEVNI